MNQQHDDVFKTVLQVLAILGLAALVATVVHKVVVDISVLAQRHSGGDFWAALARHVLRNLAGG